MFQEIYLVGVLRTLSKLKVVDLVPLAGEISVRQLATRSGIKEELLTRLLKMAMANYYFKEPQPKHVAHTARSKALAGEPGLRVSQSFLDASRIWLIIRQFMLELEIEYCMPAVRCLVKTLTANPQMDSPEHAPFCVASGVPFFQYMDEHPEDRVGFAKSMQLSSGRESWDKWASSYHWNRCERGVVDVSFRSKLCDQYF